MSAMPGPIPGSHTASHELTRIYTLTIHDATHLPLCASTGGGLGAIPSLLFQSLSITTNHGDFDSDFRRHGHKCQDETTAMLTTTPRTEMPANFDHNWNPTINHPSSSNTSPSAFSELIQPLLRQDVAIGTLQHSFQAAETPQDTTLQQQPDFIQKTLLTTPLKRY